MRWHNRYELRGLVAAGSTTWHGRETSSGTAVFLHLLEDPREILQKLPMLPPTMVEHVWDVWEFRGALYVVTDEHLGESSLRDWMKPAHAGNERPAQGDFTRVFQTIRDAQAPPADAGEFTRLLQANTGSAAPSYSGVQIQKPGEFTQFLSSPLLEQPPKPSIEPASGEVITLFRRAPQRPIRPASSMVVTPPAPAPATREIGDFTRLLGPSLPAETAAKPEATPSPVTPSTIGTPGEYTRLVSTPRPPVTVPANNIQSPPVRARSRLAPLLVFSGIGVLSLALILFFALWR